MHDTIIANALIVDGTNTTPFHADIALADGLIAAIGQDLGSAEQCIDGDGLALAPGIIDGHTHYDAQITWDPYVAPSPALGVTTIVIGNCGFTIAPCRPADRDRIARNLTQVEGMSLEALQTGIDWDFETFPEYLDSLAARGVGPNVAAFFGHSSLRTFVLGDDASKRAATDAEIATMADMVRQAMAVGAVGFATSTNEPHNGAGGVPMPSRLADEKEMTALTAAMRESGRGLFMLTKGMCTSVADLERLAANTGAPILIAAMFHSNQDPNGVFTQFDAMTEARGRGHMLIPQTSCCPLTMDFTMASAYLFEGLAAWRPAIGADQEQLTAIYRDPTFRTAVKQELAQTHGKGLFNGEWDAIHIVEAARPENTALENRSIAHIAAERGLDPLDCILEIALGEDLATTFIAGLLHSDEAAVSRLLQAPEAHIALSDAGAHLTFLCDAGFGLHLLGHWSRDKGVLSLAQAVHRLTGQPADLFGITDRGRIALGQAADLMLFDPATIGRSPKRRVHDLPAGASRLTTDAVGLHGVWVNGHRIIDAQGQQLNRPPPGKLLRHFADPLAAL
ncbi:MAG: N-acyl-D-amino-acid deacylase family protein [Alphaproteobacteria bacterium]